MLNLQELGDVPDKEAYRTWNMGQGMFIITPEPDKVEKYASARSIESRIAGEIKQDSGISLKSMGAKDKGKYLSF